MNPEIFKKSGAIGINLFMGHEGPVKACSSVYHEASNDFSEKPFNFFSIKFN